MYRYLLQELNTSVVKKMLCETEKNMGFINACNNPLNPKLHASNATCIWKPDI